MYIGVDNKAKKVNNSYIGVNGQAKKVSKIYIGDANSIARLAWENIQGEIIDITDKTPIFDNTKAYIFNKPSGENVFSYTVPETGMYRIETITPATQDVMSEKYQNQGMMLSGTLVINSEQNYPLQGYDKHYVNINGKAYANKTITIGLQDSPIKGYSLGRGSSYGAQYMKLNKGQKIEMGWYDDQMPDYLMDFKVLNNSKLSLEFSGGDSLNKHYFRNYAAEDQSPISNQYHTFSFNTINLPVDKDGVINIENILNNNDFQKLSDYSYAIYSQDQYVYNSDKCNALGLGEMDYTSAIGNYSLYLMLDFSTDYKTVKVTVGSTNSYSGRTFEGCFRITPFTFDE